MTDAHPRADGAAQPPDSRELKTGMPICCSGISGKYTEPAMSGANGPGVNSTHAAWRNASAAKKCQLRWEVNVEDPVLAGSGSPEDATAVPVQERETALLATHAQEGFDHFAPAAFRTLLMASPRKFTANPPTFRTLRRVTRAAHPPSSGPQPDGCFDSISSDHVKFRSAGGAINLTHAASARCHKQAPAAYLGTSPLRQREGMRKPKQTFLDIPPPTLPGALRRGRRSRSRVQSLRKPILLDYESWMQLTQGAVDAAEAASRQGRLNFGQLST